MSADDASSAEMRRLPDRDADPLAIDDDTVERLLSGTLPPAQAPAGYAKVAELLAAAAAAPSSAELAGQRAVLAELRAVTRGRRSAVRPSRRVRTSQRRRRAGLGVDRVAAIMGKRPGTVRVLTHRGLRRLAERLGNDGRMRRVV